MRCYLAIEGGFKTQSILGSRSQYKGITSKGKIEAGDKLKMAAKLSHSSADIALQFKLEKSVSKIVRNKAIKITIEVTEVKNADMSDVLLAGYVPPFTAETFTTACKNQQASSPPMN